MGMYILTVEDEEKPEQLAERKLLHGGYQISKMEQLYWIWQSKNCIKREIKCLISFLIRG